MSVLRVVAALLALTVSASAGEVREVVVEPQPIDDLFANPGMGWQTFHCFADRDAALDGLPSGNAYVRIYWHELEDDAGEFTFAVLDDHLARARKAGQRLMLRVMCASTDDRPLSVPAYLRTDGCAGHEYRFGKSAQISWMPSFDDPAVRKAHERLVLELGRCYAAHPDLEAVDIGSLGLWGEWHMAGTDAPMPSLAAKLWVVDLWRRAFPDTPMMMLINDTDALRHAAARGCGWRGDSLGDYGHGGWNHMAWYPKQLADAGAQEAWRVAPVAFESSNDMRTWVREGWDIGAALEYALAHHASYINNKSAPLPAGARPLVEAALRRLGYRLVLKRARYRPAVGAGAGLTVKMDWENIGVAPPYVGHRLALRLDPPAGGKPLVTVAKDGIRGWMPGEKSLRASFGLPKDLPAGRYALKLGIVDPATGVPGVRLAIAGRDDEGWYPLGDIVAK
ncbi:MAG TPA: DUF4832 domain-containing protein [Planctomycetota bacterium]|nr:DUF4832 domain-containing protein [Planctomycetota bacterium]